MSNDTEQYKTPGQLVASLLKEREWSQRTLSIIIGIDETIINKIVTDKRRIDARIALLFEEIFEEKAERFLRLQKTYDLAVERIKSTPDPDRATRAHLFGGLPVSAMIKRGWVDAKNIKDIQAVENSLCNFFHVNRVEDIEFLPHAAKKTDVSIEATPSQMAWLYRVKTLAEEMIVGRYSHESVQSAVKKIKKLLSSAEELRKVPRILAEAGVRFVIVEALPSSKIDGVCYWLNHESPVIGMTMRFDRIDNFCFVLRHELEHVLNRDGLDKMMLDVDIDDVSGMSSDVEQQELIANNAAAEFCVPKSKMDSFISRKSPFFAERDIIGLSRMIGVHAGLVAGQLQRRTGKYNLFRGHLVPVRDIVAPNAITDGWGNVAPVDI